MQIKSFGTKQLYNTSQSFAENNNDFQNDSSIIILLNKYLLFFRSSSLTSEPNIIINGVALNG